MESALLLKADQATVDAGLLLKANASDVQPLVTSNAPLAQTLVDGLPATLGALASITELNTAIATREPAISADGLSQDRVTGLSAALADRVTDAAHTAALSGKQDLVTQASPLAQNLVSGLTTDLAARATTQALIDGLASREPVMVDGGLSQSKVNGLSAALAERVTSTTHAAALTATQSALGDKASSSDLAALSATASNKQPLITDGSLTIAKTANLQSQLDSKAASSALTQYVSTSSFGWALALKQDLIQDSSLAISSTSGLQSALDAKQNTLVDDALQISHISGLQAALDNAGGEIADGQLTIAKTNGLQSALDAKASTAGMNTALSYKQRLIGVGSIAVSATSGLQTALDSKGPALSDLPGTFEFPLRSYARDRPQNLRARGHCGRPNDRPRQRFESR